MTKTDAATSSPSAAPPAHPADPAHLAFHPPLIRLQQKAPSPIGRCVLWCLLALLVFLIVWASVGRLDIVAVAEGKLVPQDYLKIVQPSEAGIVSAILVREGQTVQKDQVLMRMDALSTEADLNALGTERWRKRLALRRLDAELANQPLRIASDEPLALAQEAMAQQQANQAALASALAEERSRMLKARQELAAAQQQSQRLQAVMPHYQAQETAYAQLADQGFTGQLMVSDKRRERIEKEQEFATQQHVIASARASIDQSVKKLEQIEAEHRQRLHAERAETLSQLDRLEADWQKQQHRHALMELRAPHEGIVKELATHTVGTVVQPGTVLATLVPQQGPLKVEVWVSNDDIGFVRPGQPVKLKLAAYPFQKYGMAHGELQWVNADAQTDEPGQATAPNGAPPPPRYKATVALKEATLKRDGRSHELTAGMQAQAEILLGQRTVLQYLLSPVQRAWHEAGRER
jgi:hemolysin D